MPNSVNCRYCDNGRQRCATGHPSTCSLKRRVEDKVVVYLDLGFPPRVISPPSPAEREAILEEYRRYWPIVTDWVWGHFTTRDPATVTEDEKRPMNVRYLRDRH